MKVASLRSQIRTHFNRTKELLTKRLGGDLYCDQLNKLSVLLETYIVTRLYELQRYIERQPKA